MFAPSLVKNNKSKELGQNVQKLLIDLENNLGSILRKSDAQHSADKSAEDDCSGLFFSFSCSWKHFYCGGAGIKDTDTDTDKFSIDFLQKPLPVFSNSNPPG